MTATAFSYRAFSPGVVLEGGQEGFLHPKRSEMLFSCQFHHSPVGHLEINSGTKVVIFGNA